MSRNFHPTGTTMTKKNSTAFYGGILGAVTSLRVHLKTLRHYQDITAPIEELTE